MFPCKRTRIKQEQLEHDEVCGDAPGDAVDVASGGHEWEGHAVSAPAPFPTSQRIGELDVVIDRLLQRLGPAEPSPSGVPGATEQEAAAIDVGSGQTQQQTLAADSGKARTQQARIDDLETALEHLHSRFTQVKSLPSPHAAADGRSPDKTEAADESVAYSVLSEASLSTAGDASMRTFNFADASVLSE